MRVLQQVFHRDVDVGEVLRLAGLVPLNELNDDCEPFLAQDLDRVDWSVKDGYLVHLPLHRHHLLVFVADAALA